MKTIGANLKTHFGQECTTVTTCWRLQRPDGTEYCYTAHDEPLVIDGDTYLASGGMAASEFDHAAGLNVDSIDIVVELGAISEADIQAGLFDGSAVDVFLVNWSDLTQGKLYLAQGWTVGNIEIRDNVFEAECRGKAQHLQQNLVELYSPSCRAELGDTRCGVDLTGSASTYFTTATVTAVTDRQTFVADSLVLSADDIYTHGLLTWTGGPSAGGLNTGYAMEVRSFDPTTGAIVLFLKMPYEITVGDEFTVTYGCDKSATICRTRFNNLVNFRGEPFIPGTDKLLDYEVPPT